MYAIVRCGGRQRKVSVGDVLEVDRVADEPGSTVTLPALLVVDDGEVTTDPDALSKYQVSAEVLGEAKGAKINILKFKNKTRYRRRLGHRQRYTQVRVTDIGGTARKAATKAATAAKTEQVPKAAKTEREKVDPKKAAVSKGETDKGKPKSQPRKATATKTAAESTTRKGSTGATGRAKKAPRGKPVEEES